MSGQSQMGSEMNGRRGQGKEGEKRQKRKEKRPYHDNCMNISRSYDPAYLHQNQTDLLHFGSLDV